MTTELPEPIRAFDDAQRRAIAMLKDVRGRLEAGMSERDVVELAETRLEPHGFDRWYHLPEVRIGPDAGGGSLLYRPSTRRVLEPGGLIGIDIGPATADAYGDIGFTLCFGGDEPKVVKVARDNVRACCGYASRWKTVGEIFVFARAWAVNNRMTLVSEGAVGHRVLPKEGLLATGFPRSAHAATYLPKNRISMLQPVRMKGMFAIRPAVKHGELSAAFEEVIWIQDEQRKVLGRSDEAEIGVF
ncbi:MAG: M24 family metallopeptidase [Myxococcota bacterium]